MWRCTTEHGCYEKPPYFGFIWIKEEHREPQSTDLMWTEGCEHQFERYNRNLADNPKEWKTQWECIIDFHKFIAENEIRIKTKKVVAVTDDNNNDTIVPEIIEGEGEAQVEGEGEPPIITNEHYVNFDRQTKEFMNVNNYLKVDVRNSLPIDSRTGCMICLCKIADENVIEHLKECTGIEFSLDLDESLPIFKID